MGKLTARTSSFVFTEVLSRIGDYSVAILNVTDVCYLFLFYIWFLRFALKELTVPWPWLPVRAVVLYSLIPSRLISITVMLSSKGLFFVETLFLFLFRPSVVPGDLFTPNVSTLIVLKPVAPPLFLCLILATDCALLPLVGKSAILVV